MALYTGEAILCWDMPVAAGNVDPYGLAELVIELGPVDVVAVEVQQAYPRQGASSGFKTGRGYGAILGVLAVLERPVAHVTASEWTRKVKVGNAKNDRRQRCKEIWPLDAWQFKRGKDDGRADASLIAWWAMHLREGRAA
ncbi:MAG: hypothetical protein NVS9B11_18250 [Candidatus Dormibacteraceae bacterium]